MFRHPSYLEVPWDIHWHHASGSHRRLRWLIAALILAALLVIGVSVTSGIA